MKFYTIENKDKSIFKTFAIYYMCMAVFCVLRILFGVSKLEGVWLDVVFTVTVQGLVLFLMPFILYTAMLQVTPKQLFKTCNFAKINFATIMISIGIGILCFFVNVAVSSLFNGIISFMGYRYNGGGSTDYSIGGFFLQILLVCVLPAFGEEFLHRGIVLQGTKHMGFKKSIVLSSLLFGLIHFNINQVFYAFVIGLILGFIAVVSKNIWPAIIVHFVNNFISVYLDYAAVYEWPFGKVMDTMQGALKSGQMAWVFIISAIVMIVVVVLLCLLVWLLYKQTMIRKVNKAIDKVYKNNDITIDSPIILDAKIEIEDLLEKNTLLNLEYKKMDNPIDMVLPKEKSCYKVKAQDKIFLWGAIVLGALTTIFTYVWGLL